MGYSSRNLQSTILVQILGHSKIIADKATKECHTASLSLLIDTPPGNIIHLIKNSFNFLRKTMELFLDFCIFTKRKNVLKWMKTIQILLLAVRLELHLRNFLSFNLSYTLIFAARFLKLVEGGCYTQSSLFFSVFLTEQTWRNIIL